MATTYTAGCSSVGGFGYASNFTLYVELEDSESNVSANTSRVWYHVYCSSNGSGSINSTHLKYFVLNGTTIINSEVNVNVSSPNAMIEIASGSLVVTHNSDGTKTIPFSAQIKGKTYGVSASVSGNFTTNRINRYPSFTTNPSITSKTSTSLTFNYGACDIPSDLYYSLNNSNWTHITSQSTTISSLSPNTTYTIYVQARNQSDNSLKTTVTCSGKTFAATTPTISLSSKTVNSITVTSSCNVTVSSTQYRIKSSSGSYGAYQNSATFTGLTPNTTYTVEVKKVGQASGEAGTATINITTYQIATISSAPNTNHGDNETITYSNPSGGAIAIGIYNTAGTTVYAAYRTCTGSSYTFSFTDAELNSLYKLYGNNNTITVRVYLRTSANNVNYTNYKNITITLTGNQKTGYSNVNGTWKRTKRWVNVNGTWKRCVRWINVNGTWKRCI